MAPTTKSVIAAVAISAARSTCSSLTISGGVPYNTFDPM